MLPILSSWFKQVFPLLKSCLWLGMLCIRRIYTTWKPICFLKFLITIARAPTSCSSEDDKRIPNLDWTIGDKEEMILKNKDNMKNIITSKIKKKLWGNKELEGKRKLRYHKKVVSSNPENQKYLFSLTNVKKKINIAKIRTNSHEFHSET